MASQSASKVGTLEKIGYGVGDLPSGLYLNFFGLYLLYFFADLGGVAPAAIALMLLLTRLFDAVTDPMMGALADRTRTRWGRYRPYLLFGAIPFGLTGAAVFAAPDLSPGWLLVWAYVTYTLAMLAFTAANIPYSGLLGVISPSARERTGATAYRMLFSAGAGIMVGVLATTLVREFGEGDEARGIFLTMCCIAVVSVIAYWITFASTKERIPPAKHHGAISRDLKTLVTTGAWIAVAISAVMGVVAISARAASAKFYFKYVVGVDGTPVFLFLDRVALFLTALALGQVLGVLIGYALQRKFEKAHLILFGGTVKFLAIVGFYLLPLDAVWLQTFVQLFVGIGFGFLMVLSFSMFTDIAEYIDWKSHQQMTALTVAASIFAVKAGMALGGSMPGFVLGATGFVSGIEQDALAITGINAAFAFIPAAILLPAGIALWFYRLDHATLAKVEADLQARRALQG